MDGSTTGLVPAREILNGSLLAIWPNETPAPRLTAFIASCILLVGLFLLVKTIFDSEKVAILAALFVLLVPRTIWLSVTPMLEMVYLAVELVAGYYDSVVYYRMDDHRNRDTQSISIDEIDVIYDALLSQDTCLVALRTSALNSKAGRINFLQPVNSSRERMIYKFRP